MGEYLRRPSDDAAVSAFATTAIAVAREIDVSAMTFIGVY